MRIIVCIKQVPGSNEVRLDPETHAIIRDARQAIINPFDSYAVELAIQLREALGGKVTALSMGIPATERLLRDCESRGVDEAVLLSDRAFAGADTLATAYTLSLGVRAIGGADLIICGKMAVDGDTAQIGPELARQLGIPVVTDVSALLAFDEEALVLKKATETGSQRLRVALPALITVQKDINMPRLPSIDGIRRALTLPFVMLDAKSLGADPARCGFAGSPTQVVRSFTPEGRSDAVELSGEARELAGQIYALCGEGL